MFEDTAVSDASETSVYTGRKDVELTSVVICAAGTVMVVICTPLFVYAQKQYGDSVGMKSPGVGPPKDALVYVTKKS